MIFTDELGYAIDELVACQIPVSMTKAKRTRPQLRADVERFLINLVEQYPAGEHDGRDAAQVVLQHRDGLTLLVDALLDDDHPCG